MHNKYITAFLRNSAVPLTLRKKFGKCVRVRAGQDFALPLFNLTYHGRTGSHIDDKVFLYGGHEAATLRLMRNILKWQRAQGQTTVLIDIGTNSGVHLLSAAPFCDSVHGFEPWKKVYDIAQVNITANHLNHVTMHPFGLSDTDEDLPFLEPVGANLGVGAFVKGTAEEQARIQHLAAKGLADAVTLRVRNGDAVMTAESVVPTLVKIDTEGFEKNVLAGLRATIAAARPVVIFEYSTVSRLDFDPPGALEHFFGPGYIFYGIMPSREYPALRPFEPGKRYENLVAWPYLPYQMDSVLILSREE